VRSIISIAPIDCIGLIGEAEGKKKKKKKKKEKTDKRQRKKRERKLADMVSRFPGLARVRVMSMRRAMVGIIFRSCSQPRGTTILTSCHDIGPQVPLLPPCRAAIRQKKKIKN
jgi:hypothetical protein